MTISKQLPYQAQAASKKSDKIGSSIKRFWREASVHETATAYEVRLDDKALKTPLGHVMTLPNRILADAISQEWQDVDGDVSYDAMPLTRLGFAAIDHMDAQSDTIYSELMRYASTDHICYPSTYPEALVALEKVAMEPILQWVDEALELYFIQNNGLLAIEQPPKTIERLGQILMNTSPYERAGLSAATPIFGSILLSLCLWKGRLSATQAFEISRLAERFQAQTWGIDEQSQLIEAQLIKQVEALDIWFNAI